MKWFCFTWQQSVCLLLFFLTVSCNAQNTINTETKRQHADSDLQSLIKAGIDPYFIESRDTVSAFGPYHITRDLLQDRNGIYWFATWLGIISYDGKLFTNHTLKDKLIHFHVVSVFEDSKGNIWFGTARGGLYKYSNNSFTLFTTHDGLPDNTIICMAEDKDGQLWFGTENGASRYDNKTFTNYTTRDGLCGNYINAIIQDKTGKLWFGSDGISCYKNKRFTNFTKKDGSAFKRITALYEDQSGNIWIGTFNGLSRYDGTNFTDFLSKFLTYYIIGDKQGNMWLTHSEPNTHYSDIANQLIYKYDGKEFTKIIEKYEPNDFQIFGKTADKDGNIWFGTMHGPCRYNVNSSRGQKNTFSYFSDPLK